MSLPKELLEALKQDKEMLAQKFEELKAKLNDILNENATASAAIKPVKGDSKVVDAVNNLGDKIKDISVEANTETAFSAFIEQGKVANLDLQIQKKVKNLNELAFAVDSVLSKKQLTALKAQIKLLEKGNGGSSEEAEKQLEVAEDTLSAAEDITKAVREQKPSTKQEAAFSSIIAQGKLAEEDVKMAEEANELEKNLAATRKSLSADEIAAAKEQIALLRSGKLKTLEEKKEAREMAGETNGALKNIADNQVNLIKEFKSGLSKLRGEGLLGLLKMLLIGIPAMFAGFIAGIGASIVAFLSKFEFIRLLFEGIAKFFNPVIKLFAGAATHINNAVSGMGILGDVINGLGRYAQMTFNMGKALANSLGKLVFPLTILIGIIGAIKGGIKGFKEDGIIGMLREGIIGVFDILIGGLVKMVGSMIGGIFKLLGFEKIGQGIKNGFSDFVDGIVGLFRGTFNVLAGLLTLNFDRVKEGIGQFWDGIINTVVGALKGLGGIILGLVGALVKGVIGLVVLAVKGTIMALKALLITLPIALIKFIGKALYFGMVTMPILMFELAVKGLKKLFVDLPIKLLDLAGKAFKFMIVDLPIIALNAIVKGLKFMSVTLPLLLLKVAFKILKGIFFDLPLLALKLVFKGLKFLYFDLPLKLLKLAFPLLKGIFFDLPVAALKFVFTALKAILFDLPLKLVGFAAGILKGIFFDLPVAAFRAVFDGIKFLFIGLPTMLIDKVKSFFTSMVESIGDAFSSAFDFVKRIGAASKAALKAALPGGESPKEAFMRVMGGEGGEKEEKENLKKMQTSPAEKIKEKFKEKFLPKIKPKQKETAADFETRMMSTVNGDTPPMAMAATETGVQSFSSEGLSSDTDVAGTELKKPVEDNSLFGKIKGIGNMMKDIVSAPFKLLGKVKDSVLGMAGEGVDKVKGIAGGFKAGFKKLFGGGGGEGMTPVLSSKTPKSEGDPMAEELKDANRDQFTGNMLKNLASDQQMTLSNFDNIAEQYVNPVDQIEGESIIRDEQYEMVRRDGEGSLLDAGQQFISPEDLEYVDSVKNKGNFEFEGDARVKQILDDGTKKKLNVSDEDFTFDKRKEIIQGQLQKKEDDMRAQARDARIKIQEIEAGTYKPESPAASIAAGTGEVKAPKKLSFMDVMKKAGNFAKKAASFTPPGMLLNGVSKVGGLAKDAGDGFFDKLRGAKEQKRIAQREKFKSMFGFGGGDSGPELSMSQKENAELKGESNKGGGGAIIAPSSSVNNSKSSVTNTTISAPPHIDRTQNLFANTSLDW